jgi:hypothetical protein
MAGGEDTTTLCWRYVHLLMAGGEDIDTLLAVGTFPDDWW